MKTKHIVVLGAGFGGLTFCQAFNHPQARVTLVDRQNHHLFQPLLYQVATAGLSAPEIAQPVRSILSARPSVTVLLDTVVDFNLTEKKVFLEKNTLAYDYRVLAHLPPGLSASAQRQLEKLGVEVRVGVKVKTITQGRVEPENGRIIEGENIIWAAGVSANPLTQKLRTELDHAGRVKVKPDL